MYNHIKKIHYSAEKSKSFYGGDFISLYIKKNIDAYRENNKIVKKNKTAIILSKYLIIFNPNNKNILNLIKNMDKIIMIDTYADKYCDSFFKNNNINQNKCIRTYDINKIIEALHDVKLVFSSRLHGGLISCLMNIPTFFIPSDNSYNEKVFMPNNHKTLGSFKYHCIAHSSITPILGFGEVINIEYIDQIDFDNIDDNLFDIYSDNYLKKCEFNEDTIIHYLLYD